MATGSFRSIRDLFRLIHVVIDRWFVNNGSAAAAAVAFYALFSLAPTLVFAIAVASPLLGNETAYQSTVNWLGEVLHPELAKTLVDMLKSTRFVQHGFLPTLAAGLMLLWGSSATFDQIRVTLNRILGAEIGGLRQRIRVTVLGRLISAACAIGSGLILVSGIATSAFLSHASRRAGPWGTAMAWIQPILIGAQSWFVVGLVFGLLLKYLPVRRPSWRSVFPAALVATLLFEVGKYVMGLYISRSIIASAYGPSGAIVAIIVWIYYSSHAFLLGAELMAVLEHERPHDLHPFG